MKQAAAHLKGWSYQRLFMRLLMELSAVVLTSDSGSAFHVSTVLFLKLLLLTLNQALCLNSLRLCPPVDLCPMNAQDVCG